MSIINWLLGKSTTPKYEEPPRVPVDWLAFENRLAEAVESEVAAFAASHTGETFYALALDCNAHYCNVLLCLNTPEQLHESSAEYAGADIGPRFDHELKNMRWGLGDWKYHPLDLANNEWYEGLSEELGEYPELLNSEDSEVFLRCACRALLRAEKSGVFSTLKTTDDFAFVVIDLDEDFESGNRRMIEVSSGSDS